MGCQFYLDAVICRRVINGVQQNIYQHILDLLTIKMEHRGLENILATHDRISNRLSFSIIIAALIIGSALIVISETPPLFYGISLIGIILFLGAALLGVWLLVAIIKKGL